MKTWNLSGDSQQFEKLCQIDEVLDELSTDDLVTKIFEIVIIICLPLITIL